MPENIKAVAECRPDYEREYYRLIDVVKHLENENVELRETILGMCKSIFSKGSADNGN